MNTDAYIPTCPEEIEHVIDLLRDELRPEWRSRVREGDPQECGVFHELRSRLKAMIALQVPRDELNDWSDFAHLTGDTDCADWVRAAASAVCNLHYLERVTDDGTDEEFPEWGHLREALLKLAAWTANSKLYEQEKTTKRAEAKAQEAEKVARKAKRLIERQGKKTMLPKTVFYLEMIKDNPEMGNKEIADKVFDEAPETNDGESHFFWNDSHEVIDRLSRKPITVEQMAHQIQTARYRHIKRPQNKPKTQLR